MNHAKSFGFALAAILSVAHCAAIAADWAALEGTYALTPQNYLDPAPDEPKGTHLRLQLRGMAARDLFNAMKVPEVKDACTAARAKRMGEMQCLRFTGPTRYECHFAIELGAQKIESGVAC